MVQTKRNLVNSQTHIDLYVADRFIISYYEKFRYIYSL